MNILEIIGVPYYKDGSRIHIKEKNKGKFTESAKQHNMGVQEFATHVLNNKDKYIPTQIKRANFARNAKKFKHAKGGLIKKHHQGGVSEPVVIIAPKINKPLLKRSVPKLNTVPYYIQAPRRTIDPDIKEYWNKQYEEEKLKEQLIEDLENRHENPIKYEGINNIYNNYHNSAWGKAVDKVGLGLDVLSTVPGIGPVAAGLGIALDTPGAVLSFLDMAANGVRVDNVLNAAQILPIGEIATRSGRKILNKKLQQHFNDPNFQSKVVDIVNPYFRQNNYLSGIEYGMQVPEYMKYFVVPSAIGDAAEITTHAIGINKN